MGIGVHAIIALYIILIVIWIDPIENISKCPRCKEKAFAIVPKIYEQFNDIDTKELIIENKENK